MMAARYLFRFSTSSRRGAGTTAPIRVNQLLGTTGKSLGPLEWWWKGGFPAGSEREFAVAHDQDLGELKHIQLELAAEDDGWLLDRVVVEGYGLKTSFPYGRWLGASDAADGESGPRIVTIMPGSCASSRPEGDKLQREAVGTPLKKIVTCAAAIPQPTKVSHGVRAKLGRFDGYAGEDAYFISQSQTRFGVADGVSQWTEQGVDAGMFSRALSRGALKYGTVFGATREAAEQGVRGSSTLTLVDVRWFLRTSTN
jgi:hypothetical protein